jgi:glycolate oxidase iron-sulfur subunit
MTTERETLAAQVTFVEPDSPPLPLLEACVHCGLCLSACPTYRETGLESFGPRGRLYLMRSVAEQRFGLESAVFQEQMQACLNCRACEAVCPSGVQYGALLEDSRAQIERARADGRLPPNAPAARLARRAAFGLLFRSMRLFRAFSRALWLYQRSGAQVLARRSGLLRRLGLADAEALLPRISDRFVAPRGQVLAASGPPRRRVALLSGCVMSTAFSHVHAATLRVLRHNGCDVVIPASQGCCGALHAHGGDLEGARALARTNIAAFERLEVDAIIVNAAGCGSTLKEYGHLLRADPTWATRAQAFAASVRDISEFLDGIGLNTAGLGRLPLAVTYQEPCHLAHAQRISAAPRRLLASIPGLTLREMAEAALCCGSAGIYNITQPDMAARLGRRKVDNALATGAELIVTANPGCHLQLCAALEQRGQAPAVQHIVEVLDRAYALGGAYASS